MASHLATGVILIVLGLSSNALLEARVAPPVQMGLTPTERAALRLDQFPADAGISFLKDGTRFVVYGKTQGSLHLFDCKDLSRPMTLKPARNCILRSFAVCSQSSLVVCGASDGYCVVWDLHSVKERTHLVDRHLTLNALALTRDGSTCAIGGGKRVIRLMDTAFRKKTQVLRVGTGFSTAVCFSRSGQSLVVGSEDGSISVLGLPAGKPLAHRKAHGEAITSIAFSPDDKTLVVGSMDEKITVWNTQTWKLQKAVRLHRRMVTAVAFSPSGKQFASASADGSIIIYDTVTCKSVLRIHPDGAVHSIDFHPRAPILASVAKRVQFWNLTTGAESVPPRR